MTRSWRICRGKHFWDGEKWTIHHYEACVYGPADAVEMQASATKLVPDWTHLVANYGEITQKVIERNADAS